MAVRCALLATVALAVAACTIPGREVSVRYTNPVLDADFPDPAVLRAPDGYYYAYATQGSHGGQPANVQVARSADLVHWDRLGDALPVKPIWAAATRDFWAPDVSLHGGRYILHYSAKPDAALQNASQGLCLAVATAARPQGPFTDVGRPLLCGAGFVNIDPFAFRDPVSGRRYLYWGSGFGPIKVQELARNAIGFAAGSRPIDLVFPGADAKAGGYQRLVEGAWVIRRGGWYYLFYSGDNCCGVDAHYAVMVARSRRPTGPFATRADATGSADSVILRANDRWLAPGHNSVVVDDAGNWWIVYHAIDRRRPRDPWTALPNSRRVMLVDRLTWRSGWPEIAGGVPSAGPEAPPEANGRQPRSM